MDNEFLSLVKSNDRNMGLYHAPESREVAGTRVWCVAFDNMHYDVCGRLIEMRCDVLNPKCVTSSLRLPLDMVCVTLASHGADAIRWGRDCGGGNHGRTVFQLFDVLRLLLNAKADPALSSWGNVQRILSEKDSEKAGGKFPTQRTRRSPLKKFTEEQEQDPMSQKVRAMLEGAAQGKLPIGPGANIDSEEVLNNESSDALCSNGQDDARPSAATLNPNSSAGPSDERHFCGADEKGETDVKQPSQSRRFPSEGRGRKAGRRCCG